MDQYSTHKGVIITDIIITIYNNNRPILQIQKLQYIKPGAQHIFSHIHYKIKNNRISPYFIKNKS